MSQRVQRSNPVMIWIALKNNYNNERTFVNKIRGRTIDFGYQQKLDDDLLHPRAIISTLTQGDKIMFQQDIPPIHSVTSTKKWFQDFGIELLPWSILSSDLNPIEKT